MWCVWERSTGKLCSVIHKRCSGVRGNLSRVAYGFRCRRCDGTIQEVDLDDDLLVDGETYECIEILLSGRHLGGNGGADLAATARIRNGWIKFRNRLPCCIPVVSEAA